MMCDIVIFMEQKQSKSCVGLTVRKINYNLIIILRTNLLMKRSLVKSQQFVKIKLKK